MQYGQLANHLEDGEQRKQAIGGKGMEYKTNQYMIYALNKMVALVTVLTEVEKKWLLIQSSIESQSPLSSSGLGNQVLNHCLMLKCMAWSFAR